jgi:REP element-mobilizing transposase RayT
MKADKNRPQRKLIRLQEFDYSMPWWYYVTICTKNMKCWFGKVKNGKMKLNTLGKCVESFWGNIPEHYLSVKMDYYVIMPNHFHGIIILNNPVETGHAPFLRKGHNLGNVVGSFKSAVSKWAHQNNFPTFQWQPRFYDHIIRNEKDLHRIRTYIKNNPIKWEIDEYYENNG